jgi:hypothetical protein
VFEILLNADTVPALAETEGVYQLQRGAAWPRCADFFRAHALVGDRAGLDAWFRRRPVDRDLP